MPKQKATLNTVYISERLQECLRPLSLCALTTVVAPMGYGKTTAVSWYLAQREKEPQNRVIRVSVYSDNLAIFWKSVQDAFSHAGLSLLEGYACPTDDAGASLLADELCHTLAGPVSCYLFIDDFHLLTDGRITGFLCTLANRLPDNVHLIVASRDRFLPCQEALRLGRRLCQIGTEQLRLNHTELSVYARRWGTALSDAEVETLLCSSEGWFSAVYLNLRALAEHGALPDHTSDIYTMFSAAMIDPLPPQQQEFLAVMGLADEFTAEMARFITENGETPQLLAALTEQNAFVRRLPDGVTYRFHHMMKHCAQRTFAALPPETQRRYLDRCGIWYETHRQYLHAMSAYRRSGSDDALLRVIVLDAGILLASLKPADVLAFLDDCPADVLKEHPLALLVLMRRMFTWRQIPKMLELKALLLASIDEHPAMPPEERGDLLGECDLIMSFLMYNDIAEMSRLHRSASARMSRPAITIRSEGGWSFGSPSVLMMFHRQPGALDRELADMDECMPHYYKITNGHGQGAEKLMHAEAALLQGRFADAHIALESAYACIEGNGQWNMALCGDFLAWRLSLCMDAPVRCSFDRRRQALLRQHSAEWLPLLDSIRAYYEALLCRTAQIPDVFRSHRLDTINFLAPGRPMMLLIENQVYLAQGAYAQVIGRSESLLAQCTGMHYALPALHVRLQTAAAYELLGKHAEARALLEQALRDAAPDGFALPFVENYRYLAPLLAQCVTTPLTAQIMALGAARDTRRQDALLPALAGLTQREREIAALMAQRLSNREIAEKLYLSEGSVKQYINRIYGKLGIEGDTRTKRTRLLALLHS